MFVFLCFLEQITVVSRDDEGWWYGRTRDGKEGYFPAAFVTVLSSTAQGSQYSASSGAAPTASTPGLGALPPVTVVIQPPPMATPPPIVMPPMTSMAAMSNNMNPMGAQMNPQMGLQGNFMSQSAGGGMMMSNPQMNMMGPAPGMYASQGGQMGMGMMGPPQPGMYASAGAGGMGMQMGGGMPMPQYSPLGGQPQYGDPSMGGMGYQQPPQQF